MDFETLKQRLDNAPVLTEIPDSKSVEQMQELLAHPAIPLLWGLMCGARQAQYGFLAMTPAGNTEQIRQLGVTQGTIKGIEMFYNTLLEQSVRSHEDQGAGA